MLLQRLNVNNDMSTIILGIESSCDETAAAVVEDGKKILSNVISSQIEIHREYGGVVPEIASRHHIKNITNIIEEALIQSGKKLTDIDYIADRILIMKNGELIQEGTEKEITDKVEGCVWKCIVSEKEAGQITSSFIVSNMRSSGENVELRIVAERNAK
jgi:hypothetical protein